MKLYQHQEEVLRISEQFNRVAYYYDMGLGKTFIGSEKMHKLGNRVNLLVCQKSKVQDWLEHFKTYYPDYTIKDLTKDKIYHQGQNKYIGVINYDLIYRREFNIQDFTLILDESSIIANETTKRSKAILKLKAENVILLSGTPVSGRYEKLYSQCKLLGWKITKKEFYERYIVEKEIRKDFVPFPLKIVVGYRNVEELKDNLRKYGAFFKKSDEVINLPEQNFNTLYCDVTNYYKKFVKDRIITVNNKELVGDTTLTKMLYERQLCSQYNKNKIQLFKDLLNDTDDRLIVFYNFNEELKILQELTDRPVSVVNGSTRDLNNYETKDNSITFIQYQAGSKGLNLQKANKIIYFSLPLSVENFMQSQKRIHRIGQKNTCFYYILEARDSIDTKVYNALKKGEDYTNYLFESGK
jgi:SNF2 family DNA or RNA helicase